MKISELKLNQKVLINGLEYSYNGVQRVRIKNFGTVDQIEFESELKGEKILKHFDVKLLSADLKERPGDVLEFKGK